MDLSTYQWQRLLHGLNSDPARIDNFGFMCGSDTPHETHMGPVIGTAVSYFFYLCTYY